MRNSQIYCQVTKLAFCFRTPYFFRMLFLSYISSRVYNHIFRTQIAEQAIKWLPTKSVTTVFDKRTLKTPSVFNSLSFEEILSDSCHWTCTYIHKHTHTYTILLLIIETGKVPDILQKLSWLDKTILYIIRRRGAEG